MIGTELDAHQEKVSQEQRDVGYGKYYIKEQMKWKKPSVCDRYTYHNVTSLTANVDRILNHWDGGEAKTPNMQDQRRDLMDSPPQPACCRVSLAEICSLYERLFQTPVDISSVQAAVDQVCGVRLHSAFCCSSRLLDVLVEVERRRWVKEQIYWDFQLLDFNRNSSLSLSDVNILLQRAQESQITSLSWADFLTQRQETSGRVTWSELEAWLFGKTPLAKNTRIGASENQIAQAQYQEDLRKEQIRLKREWDSGGLGDLVKATEQTDNERRHHYINQEDLAEAVELKYAVLREKLFCDMLQAHYGSQVWTSMDAEQKEKNLNEFKMLAQFGLEKGSELVLSQLPGATHNFRKEESNCTCEEAPQTWTGVQGLKELQRRLELEKRTVARGAEGGSSISRAHQYFLLFAQTNKEKMESNFGASVLVVEPHWENRFWDGTAMCLEACYEELAHIRLTTGQKLKSRLEKPNLQKMPVEEDKLLSLLRRQGEARDLLFQLLQSCSHKELQDALSNLIQNRPEEHPAEELSGSKGARNPLRGLFLIAMTVTKTCLQEERGVVTWGDCAERLLVQVQLKQDLELRERIQDLVNGLDSDLNIGHQTVPNVVEEQDPVSDLIRLLQPLTPQEQLGLNQLNMKLAPNQGDPIIEQDPCMKKQSIRHSHDETEAEADSGLQAGNKPPLEFPDSTYEEMTDDINKEGGRNKNEFLEMSDNYDKCVKSDGWADQRNTQEPSEKGHYGQNNMNYRNMATDSSSQTGNKNGHTERSEHVSDTNPPGRHVSRGKGLKSEESIDHENGAIEMPSRGPAKDVHHMSKNEKGGIDEKNRLEQVPQNQLATSVLDATEGLIAGLMTLKVRVEQVYMMRESTGNPFQKPSNNNIKELPHNAQVSSSEDKTLVTPMGKSLIPKVVGKCDSSCHDAVEPFTRREDVNRETQTKPCKEIYSSNEGEGTQTQSYENHHVEGLEMRTIQGKEQNKEVEKSEKQSIAMSKELTSSRDAGISRNNDSSREEKANMHGPSVDISSEQVASAVMEAAENLIGSLKTLKEEISRASQSRITKQSAGRSIIDGYDYLEGTQGKRDKTGTEEPPSIQPAIAADKKKNEKSLEDEDVPPHVPEPVVREVSWEMHPACSHGCSHAKLWISEPDNEHISGKTLDLGIKATEESKENTTGDFKGGDEKKEPVEHTLAKDGNVGRHGTDHDRVEFIHHVPTTRGDEEEAAEYRSNTQREHGKDATFSKALMADLSKYGGTEPSSADKLALSFLEAAQNLIGGLIPGKEEVLGRVVVILTDGMAKDGDVILDQGEEFSEASGTISIMEGSFSEESQDINIFKEAEEKGDPLHEPAITEKETFLNTDNVDGDYADPSGECPGGHCERKTEMTKQPIASEFEEIEKIPCYSNGRADLVNLKNKENEEENIISATEKTLTEGLCMVATETDPELYIKIHADSADGTSKPDIGLQKGKADEPKQNVMEGNTVGTDECIDNSGCEEPGGTIDHEKEKVNCETFSGLKPSGENFATIPATGDKVESPSQEDNVMSESMVMTTTTDRDDGMEIMATRPRDFEESEKSKSDIEYTNEGGSIYEEHSENEVEEHHWRAEDDKVTNDDKAEIDGALDGDEEEHKDLDSYRSSPDRLLRNVLLATQDLIGSLTSLKDSMGNNVRSKSLPVGDDITDEPTAEQTQEQNFTENARGGGNSFCATLDLQRNKELSALGPQNVTGDAEEPGEPAGEQDDHQCTIEDDDKNLHELHSGGATLMVNRGELPADKSSHSLLQEESNTDRRTAENEVSEQVTLVPPIVGVSVAPARLLSPDTELYFACASTEPDSDQQNCKNLRNKWRSISDNQILKSRISERLQIQGIEKSKSDSASTMKRPDPFIRAIPGIAKPELGNADQLCVRSEDTRTEELTLTTTKEHNEERMRSEDIGDKSGTSDLNDPGALKDLTVSLLEATGSLIGRLATLKAELGSPQTDVTSRHMDNTESMQNDIELVNEAKTSDGNVMEHFDKTSMVGNVDGIWDNGQHTGNDNGLVYQAIEEKDKTERKLVLEIITGEECKRNHQAHGLPEAEEPHSKEDTSTGFSISCDLLTVQNEILNQDKEVYSQKDAETTIPGFPEDGHQQAYMQTRDEDQVFQEHTTFPLTMGESTMNISSVEVLRSGGNGEYPTEDTTQDTIKEQKASNNIAEIFPQQNFSDINSNLERSKITDPDGWIEDKRDDHVMATDIQQVEEKRNAKTQESPKTEDIYSLRKHIKSKVTKRKSDNTEEDERRRSSEQVIGKEHVEELSGRETRRKMENEELLDFDNLNIDKLSGCEARRKLENQELLGLGNLNIDKLSGCETRRKMENEELLDLDNLNIDKLSGCETRRKMENQELLGLGNLNIDKLSGCETRRKMENEELLDLDNLNIDKLSGCETRRKMENQELLGLDNLNIDKLSGCETRRKMENQELLEFDNLNIDKPSGCEARLKLENQELQGLDNLKMDLELAGNEEHLLENRELIINNTSIEEPQAIQTEGKQEIYLMKSQMNENMEQKEQIHRQEGEVEETGTDLSAEDHIIERGARSKDASVNQAARRWMKIKEKASQSVADTVQSDDILNAVAQVPANGVLVRNEAQLSCPVHTYPQLHMVERSDRLQDILKSCKADGNAPHKRSLPLGQVALQREKVFFRLSLREQQEALQRLRDLQREAELKCSSDRRRQMLRFQERLSIARNRKSEVDLMDISQKRSPQMTPEPLPEGDTERKKSAVQERLEKMKRERTYLMQTRRDRNMNSFRELLDPVLAKNKREDSGSELRGAEGVL